MSELREVIARALCERRIRIVRKWDMPADKLEAMLPTAVDVNWREQLDAADAALRALSEAGRTYERGVKDGRGEGEQWRIREGETQEALQALGERFGVRGGEPRVAGIERVLTALSAQLAQAREALEKADRAINAAYEQAQAEYQCHDKRAAKYDAIVATGRQAIRTTLAALTAGSTEGKDV